MIKEPNFKISGPMNKRDFATAKYGVVYPTLVKWILMNKKLMEEFNAGSGFPNPKKTFSPAEQELIIKYI